MSVTDGPNLGVMINAATGDAFDAEFRKLLRAVDVLLQGAVISKSLTAPPGSPANGDRYIVGASATGAWSGHDKSITVWTTDDPTAPSGAWQFYAPKTGWLVYNVADAMFYAYSGSAWVSIGGGGGATVFIGLSDVPGSYSGAGGKAVEVNSGATALVFSAKPFDVSVFAPGVGSASQKLIRVALARAVTFPSGASLSQAVASVAATGSTTFTLKKNGTSFATVNFAASASTGTWTQASDSTFAAGDILEIDGPGSADATLADIGITLAGIRA
ncbi:MAG: DUF2793 domain-containing protein [Candidatus Acidiferrales bacterium]